MGCCAEGPASEPSWALPQAFYEPESQLLHWAQTHPEYTQQQIIALVSQVAFGFKWNAKQLKDLVTKIEAGM